MNEDSLIVSTRHFTNNISKLGYTLRWSRFKKIKSFEICLPPDGIVLLDGKSGVGKTSILEAISFVLYDNAGNTCYPRKERSDKCKHDPTWVQLVFPTGLNIYRQRRPGLLKVQGQDIDLTDDAGQAYLNRTFGSLNHWLVGGYLQQLSISAFFSMSSEDKLDLLQQISISGCSSGLTSNPEKFDSLLNTISEKINLVTCQLKEIEMQIKVHAELYMRSYNQCPEEVRNSKQWTQEQLSEYFTNYSATDHDSLLLSIKTRRHLKTQILQSQISECQINIARIKENSRQRAQLQELINQNDIKLGDLPVCTIENILQCEKDLIDLNEQINIAQRTERRIQLLSAKTEIQRRLELIPAGGSKYTRIELDQYERIISGPTIKQLEEQLEEISLSKEYQRKLEIYYKSQELVNHITSLENKLETYPKKSVCEEIDAITKQIWAINLQQKKLTCPKCAASLQLNKNGHLDPLEDNIPSVEGISLNELNIRKSQYQQIESNYQQRTNIEQMLNSVKEQFSVLEPIGSFNLLDKPKFAGYSPGQLEKLVVQLEEAKISRQRVPSDLNNIPEEKQRIQNEEERIRLQMNIDQITKELDSLSCSDDQSIEVRSLELRRNDIIRKLTEYRMCENQRTSIMAAKEQLVSQLRNYSDESSTEIQCQMQKFQSELESMHLESQNLEYEINAQKQLDELAKLYNQHNHHQKQYNELNQRSIALQKIRGTLVTAEYIILDNILTELNRIINEILNILFDDPISVTIRSLRQLKTNNRIKPQINCQIVHEGTECSNITGTSGGEKIRVSLAIAIAFSMYSNIPFLLLDESLSTLDVVTKESTIEMIKKYLPNKLILTVNHDTTVGVYDSVIFLTKK